MLSLLVLLSLGLHTLDVYVTLQAGGLEAEGNPIAIFIWSTFGITAIILAKIVSVALFLIVWRYFESVPYRRLFRGTLVVSFLGMQTVLLLLNLNVMGVL